MLGGGDKAGLMRVKQGSPLATGQRELLPAIVLGALGTPVTILELALLSSIVSRVFVGHQRLGQVAAPLYLLLFAVVARAGLAGLEELSARRAAARLIGELRERVFAHLLRLGPAFVQRERSGELATVALEGVDQLEAYYGRYLPLQALSLITPACVVLYLLTVDPLGAAVLLCTAPVIPLLMVLVGSHAQVQVQRHWLALSRLGAQFLDTLQGLPTLLFYGRGEAAGEQVRAASEAFQERTLRVLRVAFLSGMALDIMTGMAIGLVAVIVAVQLLSGRLPFQSALLVLLLAPECYRPLRELGVQRHVAMEAKAAAGRVAEVLRTPAPTRSTSTDVERPQGALTITFSAVRYQYPNSRRPAIAGVTLSLAAGTRTALVGHSGAGKSTLIHLLLRFLEPDDGFITVNGTPLALLPPNVWRSSVALAPQQPRLFSGAIADNLRLARPGASLADLEWAAGQAGATEFIASLPEGYDTQVGEQGVLLSAGQVQRLAIARAFLKDAPLVVLDEPTSALDPEHEGQVRLALERLMQGRTALVVAHRLNTIVTSDQIAVLEQGCLIETGRHDDLLARQGAYARLMLAGPPKVVPCP